MKNIEEQEPLLTDDYNRFVLFPIKYKDIYQMYQTAQNAFWVANEIDLTKDTNDWETKLSNDEKNFIKNVLAFFSSSDSIVNENLGVRFMNEVKVNEAKAFYGFQIAMENIHQEMYSLMIEQYVKDPIEKTKLFNAVLTVPSIKAKAEWALKWISNEKSKFAERLIAFACVEGIFFSSAFASIYWLKERNLMPGLCQSNEFISRDEGLHTEFAILLYSHIKNKLNESVVHDIISSATELECLFVEDSLKVNLIGMNSELMKEYVKFCADRLLVQLGYSKIYNVSCPFDFMTRIGLTNKTNFFEHRVSDYNKTNISDKTAFVFTTEEDF
ncbi:MAG: hypothetical protein RLZZ546_2473 [Bacteroidota bacterium]|jgi:ribonucleoside-diphosphate reductase subunit M2